MFVVCGEALFDVFAIGDTSTGISLDAKMGGSPFNLATGLARMAQPVGLLTQISNGFLGERLMRALALEGIHTGMVQRSDKPTTLSLVGLSNSGVPSYGFYGEGCADRMLTQSVLNLVPADTAVICFGSYSTVMGETALTQRALIEQWRRKAVIAYDPNIRLNVQPDVNVWHDQIQWMLPRTDVLKVSDEDLALINLDCDTDEFAARALTKGVSLVVITQGEQGCAAWTACHHATVPAFQIKVIDTVGAGDSFQAALLAWLAEHHVLSPLALKKLTMQQLQAMLTFASSAAAVTCTRRGADLPLRGDIAAASVPNG